MKPFITYASTHPAIEDDRKFFAENPKRRYRARLLQQTEFGFGQSFATFSSDERGVLAETNLVVLRRIEGGRERYHFAAYVVPPLATDIQIEAFLQARGVRRSRGWRGTRK